MEVPELAADASIGLLVRRALARSVAQLQRTDPGVRQGDDPEDIHDFRVATRRLRSNLRTFKRLLDAGWVDDLRIELKWLGSEVGAVRDGDVLLQRLVSQARDLPAPFAADAEPLVDHLAQQRAAAHATLVAALRTRRYYALVDVLVVATEHPAFLPATDTSAAAADIGPRLARRPWKRLRQAVKDLPSEPEDDELHAVRILAKRCRYAAEAVAPVVGDEAGRFASAIADMQTLLGDHQDTVVAEAWLRAAAKELPETQDAVDALIHHQQDERHALRADWPTTWKSAASPKLRTWLQRR